MLSRHNFPVIAAISAVLILSSCGSGGALGPVPLKGACATAPNLLYKKWVEEFRKADASVDLSYEATGSGDGIKRLEEGTVDFAATDASR